MNISQLICLVAGPVIAVLVSLFKGLRLVAAYPKIVVLLLAIVVGVVSNLTYAGLDWEALAACILIPFSTAVAAYEVAKTTKNSLGGPEI